MALRVLILGGTGDARKIADRLADNADFAPILSLAGATGKPLTPKADIPIRIGGFGGADALADYIKANAIAAVIDATHPFAAQISANAAKACDAAGVARFALLRPAWEMGAGCRQYETWRELIAALPESGARVFLAAGQEGLAAFADNAAAASFTITARVMEKPDTAIMARLGASAEIITAAPSVDWEEEAEIFKSRRITHLVAKNAGGDGARAKLTAAAALGIETLLLARPSPPPPPVFADMEELLAALADFTARG